MKIAVIFLAVAVYGATALIPTLAGINSTAQNIINTTHYVNGKIIDWGQSTNQAIADYVKDGSQTGALWMEDGMDKMGDKTKEGITIAKDKTNQLLGIFGKWGGPFERTATIGSKVTNLTANAGKSMINVGVGTAQLGTAMTNHMFGSMVDKMAGVSSAVSAKANAANNLGAHLASSGVNKAVKVTSMIGKGIGNAIGVFGSAISNAAVFPSVTGSTDELSTV